MEENQNKLQIIDEQSPVLTGDTLIQLANAAEKQVEAMKKIKKVALSLTNKFDWTDQADRPYLQVSGCEKVARLFGISWTVSDKPVFDHEEDGHFAYTYKGVFSLKGASIEAIGTRSSRDGFFKRYKYIDKEKIEIPPSEYDKGNIKKAAYTNCLGNGISRLLGIRNITWEDLEEFAKIKKSDVTTIDYKKEGKKKAAIKNEDATTVIFIPSDVTYLEGKTKAGKDYTIYKVMNNKIEFKTFDKKLAELAKEAKEAKIPISVDYTKNQYGNDIQSLSIADITEEEGAGDDS